MFLRRGISGGLAALLLAVLAAAPAAADGRVDVFTVAGVPVDATAANANAARDAARLEGERTAYRQLLERLTLAADRNRLPRASDAMLNELVQGFEVANERSSGVRYLADYTFRFRAEAVRRLLRQAGIGFAETPSKPLVVLPVLQDAGAAVLWDDPNPWRDAWSSGKPTRGLVPLMLPLGELADVAAIDAAAAQRGDETGLKAISQRYGDDDVLVARAVPKTDGGAHGIDVTATRFSPGANGGEQTWTNAYTAASGESDADLMARAVAGTATQVEEAWKVANILNFSQAGTLMAVIPAADLPGWIAVRERLAGIPAIQSSELVSLDRREARIAIHFVGDPAQLRLALAQRDLELSGGGPDWVLQRRAGAAPR